MSPFSSAIATTTTTTTTSVTAAGAGCRCRARRWRWRRRWRYRRRRRLWLPHSLRRQVPGGPQGGVGEVHVRPSAQARPEVNHLKKSNSRHRPFDVNTYIVKIKRVLPTNSLQKLKKSALFVVLSSLEAPKTAQMHSHKHGIFGGSETKKQCTYVGETEPRISGLRAGEVGETLAGYREHWKP